MRRLGPKEQEALRKRVVAAMAEGMADAEASRVFGVSRNSIRSWRFRYAAGGAAGLDSGRPGRRAGEQTRLSPSQESALVEAICEYSPEQLELGGKLWTRRKVAALAKKLFGVGFTEQGMGKLLRRLGFSFQRPDKRAIEADPEAMRAWTIETFPAIRAAAKVEGGVVLFGDQVGVRSDQLSGRTWGRKGHTPIVKRTGKRFGLNAMSVIATTGQMYFTIFQASFTAPVFISFLDRLVAQYDGRKIHLVLDGHSVHRSRAVRDWVADRAKLVELHYLPPYAPHLNPDELVNADLKRTLADQIITDRQQMNAAVRSFFHRIQKLPDHVKSYFHAPHTAYTSSTI